MKIFALAVAALLCAANTSTAATIIDFERGDNAPIWSGQTYSEDGFTFVSSSASPSAFVSWDEASANHTGSDALFANQGDALITLTANDLSAFSIESIALSEVYSSAAVSTVSFIGTLLGGGTVSQDFTLDGIFGNQVFSFSSAFTGLASLQWTQIAPYHQFDDLALNSSVAPVPLPASIALFPLALAGLGAIGRRRRKA